MLRPSRLAQRAAVALLFSALTACGGDPVTVGSSEQDSTELVFAGEALRVRAGGDVMMGTDFPSDYLPPNDGVAILSDMATWLSKGDYTFINLEGPLCDGGMTYKCSAGGNCYAFRTPTRYGAYLAEVGVDVASLANNHALDFGEGCRAETETTLDGLGIVHSGRPGTVATFEHEDLRIGLIAFHTAAHSNHLIDYEGAAALVAETDEDHDLVFVSFHGGAEGASAMNIPYGGETYYGEDRGDLRRFAHAVVDAGADLVLGHGPHVPRAIEIYEGRLVAYSLGNFATYGRFNLTGPKGISFVLDASLDADGAFLGGQALPVKLINGGYPVRDADGQVVPILAELSAEDFPETGALVDEAGVIRARTSDAVEP